MKLIILGSDSNYGDPRNSNDLSDPRDLVILVIEIH